MILLAHMLLGAVVGYYTQNVALAVVLAILCHYFLDIFPHIEYSINNITSSNWKKSLPDFLKVFLDFLLGLVLIFLFSSNQTMIYICAIVAIIPDGFTFISYATKNKWLAKHDYIHGEIIHHLTKQKKFPLFWRIFTQVASVIICIWLLLQN